MRTTGGAIQQWNDEVILAWINKNLLAPLDQNVKLAALNKNDDSYKAIKARKLAEDKETGLLQYEQALTALKRVYAVAPETQKEIGAISELYEQLVVLEEARKAEQTERSKSASNVFKDVWDAAQKILQASDLPLDNCRTARETAATTRVGAVF